MPYKSTGLNAQLRLNRNKELVCEAQVPFALFYKETLSSVADKDKTVYCRRALQGFAKDGLARHDLLRRYGAGQPATAVLKERKEAVRSATLKEAVPLAVREGKCYFNKA